MCSSFSSGADRGRDREQNTHVVIQLQHSAFTGVTNNHMFFMEYCKSLHG